MEGASVAGDVVDRARAALNAGCDMALVCNDPDAATKVLDKLGALGVEFAQGFYIARPASVSGFAPWADAAHTKRLA